MWQYATSLPYICHHSWRNALTCGSMLPWLVAQCPFPSGICNIGQHEYAPKLAVCPAIFAGPTQTLCICKILDLNKLSSVASLASALYCASSFACKNSEKHEWVSI